MAEYPTNSETRYERRPDGENNIFYDMRAKSIMSINDVLDMLNLCELRRIQLAWIIKKYRTSPAENDGMRLFMSTSSSHPAHKAGASPDQFNAFNLIAAGTRPDCSDDDLQWLIDKGLVAAERSAFNWDVMDYYIPLPVQNELSKWQAETDKEIMG